MPGGRPKVELPEGWKETLLDLGSKGKGKVHMVKAMGMARSTFYELAKTNKEFSDTLDEAIIESQIWWENVGQEGIFMGGKDNPFQSSLWSLNMTNRFGWNTGKSESKQDITSDGKAITGITREVIDPKP